MSIPLNIQIHQIKPSSVSHITNEPSKKSDSQTSKKSSKKTQDLDSQTSKKTQDSDSQKSLKEIITQPFGTGGGTPCKFMEDTIVDDEEIPELQEIALQQEESPEKTPVQKTRKGYSRKDLRIKRTVKKNKRNEENESEENESEENDESGDEGNENDGNEGNKNEGNEGNRNQGNEEMIIRKIPIEDTDFFEKFKVRKEWYRLPFDFIFNRTDEGYKTEEGKNSQHIWYKENFDRKKLFT